MAVEKVETLQVVRQVPKAVASRPLNGSEEIRGAVFSGGVCRQERPPH